MRQIVLGLMLIVLLAAATTVPLRAHHSFAAEFDNKKQVTLTGIVTKVEWTNPHVWFYMNVKDEATGKMTNWGFEMGPPHLLQGSGWTRTTMKMGDQLTVNGSLAKNGTPRVNARAVTTKEGKRLGAGSSEGQLFNQAPQP